MFILSLISDITLRWELYFDSTTMGKKTWLDIAVYIRDSNRAPCQVILQYLLRWATYTNLAKTRGTPGCLTKALSSLGQKQHSYIKTMCDRNCASRPNQITIINFGYIIFINHFGRNFIISLAHSQNIMKARKKTKQVDNKWKQNPWLGRWTYNKIISFNPAVTKIRNSI